MCGPLRRLDTLILMTSTGGRELLNQSCVILILQVMELVDVSELHRSVHQPEDRREVSRVRQVVMAENAPHVAQKDLEVDDQVVGCLDGRGRGGRRS